MLESQSDQHGHGHAENGLEHRLIGWIDDVQHDQQQDLEYQVSKRRDDHDGKQERQNQGNDLFKAFIETEHWPSLPGFPPGIRHVHGQLPSTHTLHARMLLPSVPDLSVPCASSFMTGSRALPW